MFICRDFAAFESNLPRFCRNDDTGRGKGAHVDWNSLYRSIDQMVCVRVVWVCGVGVCEGGVGVGCGGV